MPELQRQEYWTFNFVSNIFHHIQYLLTHASRIFGVASKLDVAGMMEGELTSILDFILKILQEDTMDSVIYRCAYMYMEYLKVFPIFLNNYSHASIYSYFVFYSLQGILEELYPLLEDTPLRPDLEALVSGLQAVSQLRNYFINQGDLKGMYVKQ